MPGRIGQIGHHDGGFAACLTDFLRDCFGRWRTAAPVNQHGRASGSQFQGHGLADSARGTSHDGGQTI
jgi:hypothetical protein